MKKWIALFLAFVLLLSGCTAKGAPLSSSSLDVSSGIGTPVTERVETPFSQMEYVAPDLDAAIAKYTDFAARVRAAKSADEIVTIWEEEADYCKDYYDMYTLSNILFSLDTSDEENAANYQYMQDFVAKLKPAAITFTRAILQSPYRAKIDGIIGTQVLAAMEISANNYTDEQLELELEENKLTTQYTQLLSQSTVYKTDEHTFTASEMYYLIYAGEEQQADTASYLLNQYYADLNAKCGDIYTKLMELRTKKAALAGFDNYLDYYYHTISPRGYTRQDIENFRGWVKEYLVPIYQSVKKAAEARTGASLDLFSYTSPLPEQEKVAYLSTITKAEDLVDIVVGILQDLSPETKEMIDYMTRNELYDLTSAPNKSPGAFTTYFYGYREPFVLSNYDDAGTYLHEMGHALNFFRSQDIRVLEQDMQSSDISEIHSQGLELLASPWLDRLYADATAAEKSNVYEMFHTILSATMVDEFQHKLYENPSMTTAQRNALYASLEKEYFGEIDNRDLDFLDEGMDWVDIHHLFDAPMYYVEYALTAIVALDFWQDSKEDWSKTFSSYMEFVDIPNDVNLPDSLAMADRDSIFKKNTMADLAADLSEYFGAK